MKLLLLHILLMVICAIQSNAQPLFKHLDNTWGLSQNSVNSVFKDSEGYYWIGTQDGLNRFDGTSFEVFRHNRNSSNSISDNFILDINEDHYGQLWIGTRHCLNRYNKRTHTFTNVIYQPRTGVHNGHNSVHYTGFDKNGNLYFDCTGYTCKIRKEELTQEHPKVDTLFIGLAIQLIVSKDTMHILDIMGCYYKYPLTASAKDIEKYKVFCPENFKIEWIPQMSTIAGKVVFSMHEKFYLIDENKNQFQPLFASTLSGTNISVSRALNDKELWIGTAKGLFIGDIVKNKIKKIQTNFNYPFALHTDFITSISFTYDSLVWVGSNSSGVFVYDKKINPIQFINRYNSTALKNDHFSDILYLNKRIYAATPQGIAVFNDSLQFINYLHSGHSISCLAAGKNNTLWAGTREGIIKLDEQGAVSKQLSTTNSTLKSNLIFSLLYDDNHLWIGSERGLYCLDEETGKLTSYTQSQDSKSIPATYIMCVNKDYKNRVWVCHNLGISMYNKAENNFTNYFYDETNKNSLSYRIVPSFYCDSRNRIWVGTKGGGLNLFDETTGSFKNWTVTNGLCSDNINSITEDTTGKLWLGTSNGISCFDTDNNSFENFSTKDGLISNETSWNAMLQLPTNKLLAASPEGLIVFNLNQFGTKTHLNTPLIRAVFINNEIQTIDGTAIRLSGNKSKLTIELACPDFRNHDNIRYHYLIEGLEKEYVQLPVGSKHISFSSLPYGDYILRVKAGDLKNKNFSDEITFVIHVIPPFWRTQWFMLLTIVAIVALIVWLIFYISNQKHKKVLRKMEIEKQVYREREKISNDLHDNIGSQLTYIVNNLDYLKNQEQKSKNENHLKALTELSDFTRNTSQQLRETIWAVNTEKITIELFAQRIRNYAIHYLTHHENTSFDLRLNGNVSYILTPIQLLNIFRIIQEAMNNTVKHAQANKVEIIFDIQPDKFKIEINDNGRGFDKNKIDELHYGLRNMEQRAEKINGQLFIKSEIGKGTRIFLTITTTTEYD